MLGPNATFDRIAGIVPGEACSNRDLVLELAHALKKYDIDIPEKRFIDGAQAHILEPMGIPSQENPLDCWCRTGCRRDIDYMIDYVRKVNQAGGVVTIDIKIWNDGSFDPEQLAFLRKMGKAL